MWNIVKTSTNNKNTSNNISSMKINDKLSSDSLTFANALNIYFSLVAENFLNNFTEEKITSSNDPMSYLYQAFRQSFLKIKLRNTTTYETEKIIQSSESKNSYGYDETSRILRVRAPYVLSPLTYIFNQVLSTGVFPERLKFAAVTSYQKGEKTEFSNYRPISLLTTFSKIIEKIIYRRLYDHLNINNILVNEQFGFRDNLSTEAATYTLLNKILSSLNNKILVGGLFCDLQKAVNSVNHDILLTKMEFYGISDKAKK
jgi:hypothetical protein